MCAVCQDDVELPLRRPLLRLNCPGGHIFHGGCGLLWLLTKGRCATCNLPLVPKADFAAGDDAAAEEAVSVLQHMGPDPPRAEDASGVGPAGRPTASPDHEAHGVGDLRSARDGPDASQRGDGSTGRSSARRPHWAGSGIPRRLADPWASRCSSSSLLPSSTRLSSDSPTG